MADEQYRAGGQAAHIRHAACQLLQRGRHDVDPAMGRHRLPHHLRADRQVPPMRGVVIAGAAGRIDLRQAAARLRTKR